MNTQTTGKVQSQCFNTFKTLKWNSLCMEVLSQMIIPEDSKQTKPASILFEYHKSTNKISQWIAGSESIIESQVMKPRMPQVSPVNALGSNVTAQHVEKFNKRHLCLMKWEFKLKMKLSHYGDIFPVCTTINAYSGMKTLNLIVLVHGSSL